MGKLKVAEAVLMAVAALVSAAKAIVKFVGYVGKLMKSKEKAFSM